MFINMKEKKPCKKLIKTKNLDDVISDNMKHKNENLKDKTN